MGKSISWVDAVETGHRNVFRRTCQADQQTGTGLNLSPFSYGSIPLKNKKIYLLEEA